MGYTCVCLCFRHHHQVLVILDFLTQYMTVDSTSSSNSRLFGPVHDFFHSTNSSNSRLFDPVHDFFHSASSSNSRLFDQVHDST
jgi:hypothetical protein